ncbi:MAG TPA: outer membrane beta-barrel protein [Blastocatellia bacterium]|nr:outer membrane beta-barrel protein [Blastocatellia bacterium]
MRKFILPLAVLFLAAIPAHAQDEYPSVEIFGGYSYLSVDVGADFDDDDFDFDEREGFHGFGVSIAGNISSSFGIVGDFSYNRKDISDLTGLDSNANVSLFLFGPRFTARGDTVDGFVHALVGVARQRVEVDLPGENFDISENDLALGFGGGVDIKASDRFAIRLFQLDYIPIRAEDPFEFDEKRWTHNFRFQIGAVFRF